MIARLLVSVGVVAAAVGFTFLGMGTSTYDNHQDMLNLSYILMGVGGVITIVGALWMRSTER
jgi:hypothetical protein